MPKLKLKPKILTAWILGKHKHRLNNKGIIILFMILGTTIVALVLYIFLLADTSKARYELRCAYWSVQLGDKLNGSKHSAVLDNEMRHFEDECIYLSKDKFKPELRCSIWVTELDPKSEYFIANIGYISDFDLVEYLGALNLFEDECAGVTYYTLGLIYPADSLYNISSQTQ